MPNLQISQGQIQMAQSRLGVVANRRRRISSSALTRGLPVPLNAAVVASTVVEIRREQRCRLTGWSKPLLMPHERIPSHKPRYN